MSKKQKTAKVPAGLRERAEAKLRTMTAASLEMPPEKIRKLLHELGTHQIELEMQNEELRQTQEALEESRSRYAYLYDQAPLGYFTLNEKSLVLEANLTIAELLGVERKFLVKRAFNTFIIDEDQDLFYIHRKRLFDTKVRQSCELRLKKKDGELFWARMECVVLEDSAIGGKHVLCAILDISAQKRAEELLLKIEAREREKLVQILDGLNLSICVINDEYGIEFINREFVDLLPHRNWDKCYELDNSSAPCNLQGSSSRCAVREILHENKPSFQYKHTTPPEEGARTFTTRVYPIEFLNKRCVIEIHQDITEQVQLEEQLRHAHKLEAIGRLAGGLAHEFNNSLQVILGNTEMALRKLPAESPLCETFLEIRKSAERSATLNRQLLAFARKQIISPKILNLNDHIPAMFNMLRRLVSEAIDLIWKPGHDLWPVKIDPAQLDQILANLTVNARDAIDGVGKITFETANAEFGEAYCSVHAGYLPGEYVLLTLSDTGCGMDQETRSHVFEPFFTTKEFGKGSGLGLATVHGIVEQSGGFIYVYSELGKGTTFNVYLPASRDESAL